MENKKNIQNIIYLDNGATTKVDQEVVDAMIPHFTTNYGNPSSLHHYGQQAERIIKQAKKTIKQAINSTSLMDKIIFTASATEADNMAIIGFARANKTKGNHIITTKIEHKAILNSIKELEKEGFKITYLDVDTQGLINIEQLKNSITNKTILVSIIHANHEIGTIQDLEKIGKICKQKNVKFHADTTQSFTKTLVDIEKFNLDLVTINAHKIHGPKGIGALYIRKGTQVESLIKGGGQENGYRSGTENVPLIAGFQKTIEIGIKDMQTNVKQMTTLRDYLMDELLKIPHTQLNGANNQNRLCNNINISFAFVEGEALLLHLDLLGVCVSTGSACSSESLKVSEILTAIGRDAMESHGSLRFTISKYTTKQELDMAIQKIKQVVEKLRKLSPLTIKN